MYNDNRISTQRIPVLEVSSFLTNILYQTVCYISFNSLYIV